MFTDSCWVEILDITETRGEGFLDRIDVSRDVDF